MENSDDLFRFITALRAYTSYDLSDYSDRSLRRRLYKVLDDQRITIDELHEKARVYASDINAKIIQAAQKGEYRYRFNLSYLDNFDLVINTNPLNYEEKLSIPYSKYFNIDEARDLITIHPSLRQKPTFRWNDLVKGVNPFFVRYDVIFCRNVLIYFNASLQNRLFEMFYRNLYPGGILVLGAHESIIGSWANKFERLSQVYVRKD